MTMGVLSLLRWCPEEFSRTSGCMMNEKGGGHLAFGHLRPSCSIVGPISPKMAAMRGKPRCDRISLWLLVQPYFWPWRRLQGCVAHAASTLGCTGAGSAAQSSFPAGRPLSGGTSRLWRVSEDQHGRACWFMTVDVNARPSQGPNNHWLDSITVHCTHSSKINKHGNWRKKHATIFCYKFGCGFSH